MYNFLSITILEITIYRLNSERNCVKFISSEIQKISGVLKSSFWQISWRCHYVVVVIDHPWKGGVKCILWNLSYRLATEKNANILTLIQSHERKRSKCSFLLYFAALKCEIGPSWKHRASSDFVIRNLPEMTSGVLTSSFWQISWRCHYIVVVIGHPWKGGIATIFWSL